MATAHCCAEAIVGCSGTEGLQAVSVAESGCSILSGSDDAIHAAIEFVFIVGVVSMEGLGGHEICRERHCDHEFSANDS